MSTFFNKSINPKFNAYRKRLLREKLGPTHTYLAEFTDDTTGKITEKRTLLKGTITSFLKTRNYLKIDCNIFIGDTDFVLITRESWR